MDFLSAQRTFRVQSHLDFGRFFLVQWTGLHHYLTALQNSIGLLIKRWRWACFAKCWIRSPLSEPSSTRLLYSAWRSAQRSLRICWSWSSALWWDTKVAERDCILNKKLNKRASLFCFFLLFISLSCLSLRATWKATCTAVESPTRTLQTHWSSSEWRAMWHQGLCTSTNTTLHTGNIISVLGFLSHSPASVLFDEGGIDPGMFPTPPCGLFLQQHPGAAWVTVQKNSSISDFVAGGWTPLTLSQLLTKTVAARYSRDLRGGEWNTSKCIFTTHFQKLGCLYWWLCLSLIHEFTLSGLYTDVWSPRNRNESLQFCFNTLNGVSFGSDLALRNCLLTSEMSVKIGDYGLSHSRYKVRTLPTFPFHSSALKAPARDALLFSVGWLLHNARPDLGAAALDCARADWWGSRKPASRGPNQEQQHMVRY